MATYELAGTPPYQIVRQLVGFRVQFRVIEGLPSEFNSRGIRIALCYILEEALNAWPFRQRPVRVIPLELDLV
jgi:hypothetical protein